MSYQELNVPIDSKDNLCRELQRLKDEVNGLALKVSRCQGSELEYIWSNLANARAYLATALEASRQIKENRLNSSDWQI